VLACVDVHYPAGAVEAIAACVLFRSWSDAGPAEQHVVRVTPVAPYVPGELYRRELPGLLAVLEQVAHPLEVIVVDGYVWLDHERPGLGWHLHEAIGRRAAVVGVAKNEFAGNRAALELSRHGRRALYVTAVGMPAELARQRVLEMHGQHRIPTLLKAADRLSRGGG
jgi:deoxyribonuclease V